MTTNTQPDIEWEDHTVICHKCGDEETGATRACYRTFKGSDPPLQCPECRSLGVTVIVNAVVDGRRVR